MKEFIKGRWFLLLGVFVIVLIIVFLYLKGFRITYAPELENSWSAISACAAWAGVVASFIAIWYAIQVPQKIAEQQNKIALFAMRHEIFEIYNSCKTFSEMLRWAINKENVQLFFLNVFCNVSLDEKNIDIIYVRKESSVLFEKLCKSEFLFDTNVSSYIKQMALCFHQLITASLHTTEFSEVNEKVQEFIDLMSSAQYQSVLDKMGNDLKLK